MDILDAPERYVGARVRLRSMMRLTLEQTYLFVPDRREGRLAWFSLAPHLDSREDGALREQCPFISVLVEGRVGAAHLRGTKVPSLEISYVTTNPHPERAGLVPRDAGAGDVDGRAPDLASDGGEPR